MPFDLDQKTGLSGVLSRFREHSPGSERWVCDLADVAQTHRTVDEVLDRDARSTS